MKIIFIQTGGTIDKDYPRVTKGWAFEFGEPATIRILEKLDPSFDYEVVTACQKDSMELTEKDRKDIADLINSYASEKFIITHGTDTMIETATFLDQQVSGNLIVITGAMRPERFSNSDAHVNLGTAIATAALMTSGIYISMHGIVKPYQEIQRDMNTGKYY